MLPGPCLQGRPRMKKAGPSGSGFRSRWTESWSFPRGGLHCECLDVPTTADLHIFVLFSKRSFPCSVPFPSKDTHIRIFRREIDPGFIVFQNLREYVDRPKNRSNTGVSGQCRTIQRLKIPSMSRQLDELIRRLQNRHLRMIVNRVGKNYNRYFFHKSRRTCI